jgi:hypothetical protein
LLADHDDRAIGLRRYVLAYRAQEHPVSSSGELREGYEESRKRLGIRKEKVWIQGTPIGESIIVYWETEVPQRTLQEMADSRDEVDRKFR